MLLGLARAEPGKDAGRANTEEVLARPRTQSRLELAAAASGARVLGQAPRAEQTARPAATPLGGSAPADPFTRGQSRLAAKRPARRAGKAKPRSGLAEGARPRRIRRGRQASTHSGAAGGGAFYAGGGRPSTGFCSGSSRRHSNMLASQAVSRANPVSISIIVETRAPLEVATMSPGGAANAVDTE